MSAVLAEPVPPGWTRNPSRPAERRRVMLAALLGFAVATYLTLDQVGVVARVWDPFFGAGAEHVLHSALARSLPVPDASLGAFAYLVEVVTVAIGGGDRWRTRPSVVVVYGLTALGLGVVSTVLTIFQPVLFDSWCTLCLVSAFISVNLVGPAMTEMLAALQHLRARDR